MTFDLSRLREPAAARADAVVPESRGQRARILVVCTGNVCRSPLAALVLRARFADLDVTVTSAGTHALVGEGMTPEAVDLAVARGVSEADAAAHRAVWLQADHLAHADLVLTMERDQRRHVVELAPGMVSRVFTIREFARLVAGVDPDGAGLPALVATVAQRRGHVQPPDDPADDDVVDPYRRSTATYKRSAAQMDPALGEVELAVRAAMGS